MTAHVTRSKAAKGSGDGALPRIAVSLPREDMELVTWWAAKQGIPVASVLRDAVAAYFMPFKNNPKMPRAEVISTFSPGAREPTLFDDQE